MASSSSSAQVVSGEKPKPAPGEVISPLTRSRSAGGPVSGAISALNTAYLPPVLGLSRPAIATVFAFSGGFAYPGHLAPSGARILAQHAPGDVRVPVSSIRRLAAISPDPLILIEDEAQGHGEPQRNPGETLAAAVDRLVDFDRAAAPPRAARDLRHAGL